MKKIKNFFTTIFKYLEPLWLGNDGKISARNTLAISTGIHFLIMVSRAFFKWEADKSLEGASLVLGVEAGVLLTLLGLGVYSNLAHTKIDRDAGLLNKPSTDLPPEENRPTE